MILLLGVCHILTNMFSVGTHKVSIFIVDKNYKGSSKSKMVIIKESKKLYNYYISFTNGKQIAKRV